MKSRRSKKTQPGTVGGRVCVAVFGQPEQVEERLVFEEIKKVLPPENTGPGEFVLSVPGKLESMMKAKGLRVINVGEVETPFIYPDVDAAGRRNGQPNPFRRP